MYKLVRRIEKKSKDCEQPVVDIMYNDKVLFTFDEFSAMAGVIYLIGLLEGSTM